MKKTYGEIWPGELFLWQRRVYLKVSKQDEYSITMSFPLHGGANLSPSIDQEFETIEIDAEQTIIEAIENKDIMPLGE